MKPGRMAGMLIALALLAAPGGARAAAGDVYLADQSAGPGGSGAIFRVDLASGATTPLLEGPPLQNPADLTFDSNGQLIVADEGAEAVFRIDPATGAATEVARGGQFADPWGVAFGPAGRLFVTDVGFESPTAIVFRVNIGKNEGAKIQFSSQPPLVDPAGIWRESENAFLVTDLNGEDLDGDGLPTNGIIHRVDGAVRDAPVTPVASGTPLVDPWAIAPAANGQLLIADANAFLGGGGLLSLDPATGTVTPVASGPLYSEPVDLTPVPGGSMLVADYGDPGPGSLLSYNPATGVTASVAAGPPLVDPAGVAVEPPICRGEVATIVGSTGRDRLVGTRFADVIAGLDGNDVIRGERNNDIVCAGDGKDNVNGGQGADEIAGEGGKDRLNGFEGPDLLDGGPGKDRCNGKGSKKDRAVACEKVKKVP